MWFVGCFLMLVIVSFYSFKIVWFFILYWFEIVLFYVCFEFMVLRIWLYIILVILKYECIFGVFVGLVFNFEVF